MKAFDTIAAVYDALYQEKDYDAECDFVEQVFERYAAPVREVLDVGCGTGGHLLPLARRRYRVTGVDRSPEMLAEARRKAEQAGLSVELRQGDARDFDMERTFDAAISMFAVLSYLTTLQGQLAAFQTIHRHLNPGGLFLFDVWFGPGVLAEPPTERHKVVERGGERILRLARPEMDLLAQVVTVHYKVLHLRDNEVVREADEHHQMHFFFPQQLLHLLEASGFTLLELCPFMRLGQQPSARDWTISAIARKA